MVCSNGWIECHPGIAAWVQAVGSIIAILSGIVLLHYQASIQRRNRMRGVHAIVKMSVGAVTRQQQAPEGFDEEFDFFVTMNAEEVRFAYDALCDIPLHEIESEEAVHHIGTAIESVRRILAKLEAEKITGMLRPSERVVVGSAFSEDADTLGRASIELSKLI
jgi:hypothetical protein